MLAKEFLTCLVGFALTIGFLAGCSDNPDRQAARAIQETTAQTLDSLQGHVNREKLTKAQADLQSAANLRGAGDAKDAALLAAGNLQIMQAREDVINLELTRVPVTGQIRQIQQYARRVTQVQLQKQRIEQLLTQADQELLDLQRHLSGADDQVGLQAQLIAEQTRLSDLMDQKLQWQQKADEADRRLQSLQARADDTLGRAGQAAGDEKATLEQTGYDLLMQKKDYYLAKQGAMDQVSNLDDQVALVRPSVERLQENIRQTEEKISQLKQSDQLQQLRDLKRDLEAEENQEKENVAQQVRELQQYAETFRTASEAIVTELEAVLETYQQIRSRDQQPIVNFKTAQTRALLGSVLASRLYFEVDFRTAVDGLIESVDSDIQPLLQEAATAGPQEELVTRTLESFDKADEAFESALSSGSSLGKDFKADVTKSRLIALDEKMRLADRLDRYELAQTTQTRLDELRQAAVEEFGPTFTLSETARLLEQGLDYMPRVPVDSELFFESVKTQLSAWKSLQGTEQEQAARQTLAAIEQLEAQADENLLKLLEPEKRAIRTAIEQGFSQQAAPSASTRGPGEPNSF